MTESEWLACNDPQAMLAWLTNEGFTCPGCGATSGAYQFHCSICGGVVRGRQPHVTDRKLRLFAVACCRAVWNLLGWQGHMAVHVAEDFADNNATPGSLEIMRTVASESWQAMSRCPEQSACMMAEECCNSSAYLAAEFMVRDKVLPSKLTVAAILRDIVGNPLRRFSLPRLAREVWECKVCGARPDADGEVTHGKGCYRLSENGGVAEWVEEDSPLSRWLTWNDGTIRNMALAIYAGHQWESLPILADALEEAGCDHADILEHLRGPGPHARGCWVVDLLTGKR